MAAPATIDDFLGLLRKSEVVDHARLDEYWEQLQASGEAPDRTYRLARRMVADGLLTHFHAEQLLRGKSRGFTLRNYRILERIGRGGMGTVYLAEHQVMRHRVAIKVLPADQAEKPANRERFYREARSAAALSHPNLVRAHDVDQDQGVYYLVMEYVDGVTLHDLVARKGPLLVGRAAHFIAQAAIGLQYAHEVAGLVHRDIKPGNLVLDRTGTVKILDMGLARMALTGFFDVQSDSISKNYNDKSILGSADYIAPEQAVNSQAADVRSDIYSLGATFYYLLAGAPPFPTGTVTQKLMWHQMSEPTPLRQLRSDLPDAIATLIARMVAKDPAHRPQTPGAVVEALKPWLVTPVQPPTDDEIPKLCLAAQGTGTGVSKLRPAAYAGGSPCCALQPLSESETNASHIGVNTTGSEGFASTASRLSSVAPVTMPHHPAAYAAGSPYRYRRWWIAAAAILIALASIITWWQI